MKKANHAGRIVTLLSFLALAPMISQAATFNVSNTADLKDAISQAKANGSSVDTIRFDGGGRWHSDGGEIRVDTPVIIDGVSPTRTLLYNRNNQGVIFRILSSNVTIKNFRIHSSTGAGRQSTVGIVFDGSNGIQWNVTISGNDFWHHHVGIRNSRGVLPKNLTITNNRFFDTEETAIGFGRDSGTFPDPLNGGKYTITNNWIRIDPSSSGKRGIILDNGNDGAAVVNGELVGKGVGDPVGSIQHSPYPTVYTEGSLVSGNTILNAKRTAISFAKVSNIDIKNNTVDFVNNSSGIGAIHIEHRSSRVRIENNTVTVRGTNGTNAGCVNFSTSFYSGSISYGCNQIWVINNDFKGDSWGLKAHGFTDCHTFQNDFSSLKAKVVTWSAPGGSNSIGINWGNISLPNGDVPTAGRVGSL